MSADKTPSPKSPLKPAGRYAPSVDSVTTIREDGSRRDIHPADVYGRFTRWRTLSAWLLIGVYILLPWIPINGAPAVFIDVAESRFHFFGFTLAAQDVWLLFFGVSGLGFGLFFLTALFGRLWCGWACPQTVFLEHVFRRFERWVDGDATRRRALAAAPMTSGKVVRRVVKHAVYALIALVITHIFLAYFVSVPRLWGYMHEAPGENWTIFVFVFAAAGVLYFNFAWFREQLCIVVCPYGRLQSAMTDDHSLVIGYDARRGEPRGRLQRTGDRGQETGDRGQRTEGGKTAALGAADLSPVVRPLSSGDAGAVGDCVDCNRCVQVCPTGIDIRHGLQLECIGCAACIDACDEVMTRIERPRGLIRYDSFVGLAGGRTRWWRARTIVYAVLLLVGVGVATYAFSTVKSVNFVVSRMTGAAYFVDQADVRNQFLVRLVNKRPEPATFVVTANGLPAGVTQNGFSDPVTVAAQAEQVSPLVVTVDRRQYTGPFKFTVSVQDEARTYRLERGVEFLGPDPKLLREEEAENDAKR